MRLDTLNRAILGQITKSTDRGAQTLIGPSEIGGCPYCVGETVALQFPDLYPDLKKEERFSLAAWVGTGVHLNLDHTLEIEGAIKEKKNVIAEIEGYGTIKGSTDLYVEPHVFDYKVLGKWKFDKMRLEYLEKPKRIPDTKHRVQQMLYGYGWKKLGYDVKSVNIVAIPKESNDPRDIRFYTEKYNEKLAVAALDRLVKILENVKEGKLEDLPSDEDCYTCSRITFRI